MIESQIDGNRGTGMRGIENTGTSGGILQLCHTHTHAGFSLDFFRDKGGKGLRMCLMQCTQFVCILKCCALK